MSDGYLSFGLTGIDMAYAITQDQLNEALAEFLLNAQPQITFAYDIDGNGNPIPPADPASPQVSFSATITVPTDVTDNDQPLPIVDLSSPEANNSVKFRLGFTTPSSAAGDTGALFTDTNLGVDYQQASAQFEGGSWTVQFNVQLNQLDRIDLTTVPDALSTLLSKLNTNDETVFSLSQILIDLATVSTDNAAVSSPAPGFNRYAWIDFVSCLAETLVQNGETIFEDPLVAGYALVQDSGSSQNVVTASDVEITLVGNSATPGASLLVFGMVTSGTVPSNWATQFVGTTLISDPDVVQGVAFMRAGLVTDFVHQQLEQSAYAKTIAQYVTVSYSGGNFAYGSASYTVPAVTDLTPTSAAPQLASCVMNGGQSVQSEYEENYLGGGNETQTVHTSSTSAVAYGNGNTGLYLSLQISGSMGAYVADSSFEPSSGGGNNAYWTSPTFYFAWLANFDFTVVNDSGLGTQGIGFQYDNGTSSFPSSYTSEDQSTADSWGTVPASIAQLVAGQLSPIIALLPGTFEQDISQLFSGMSMLVFPGSGNFTFQNPGVNGAFNLVATVRYENEG